MFEEFIFFLNMFYFIATNVSSEHSSQVYSLLEPICCVSVFKTLYISYCFPQTFSILPFVKPRNLDQKMRVHNLVHDTFHYPSV